MDREEFLNLLSFESDGLEEIDAGEFSSSVDLPILMLELASNLEGNSVATEDVPLETEAPTEDVPLETEAATEDVTLETEVATEDFTLETEAGVDLRPGFALVLGVREGSTLGGSSSGVFSTATLDKFTLNFLVIAPGEDFDITESDGIFGYLSDFF